MDDAVRINAEHFRSIYETGFTTWARYFHAVKNSSLPAHCLFVQHAFSQHPYFSRNLSLQHDKNRVFVTGSSVWGSTGTNCDHDLPTFRQQMQIGVTVTDPTSLSISESAQSNSGHTSWFTNDDNYLAVLILAWAYILTARWTEVMPESCCLTYTESRATCQDVTTHHENDRIDIDIGNADPEEARWWAAILAPGQGWQATMASAQNALSSPWSIRFRSSLQFSLSWAMDASSLPHSAASFADACSYLNKFCVHHDIVDQSHAALSAVLLFPSMGGDETLQLPTPRISKRKSPGLPFTGPSNQLQHNWIDQGPQIDRLLTLSCNTRGIRPMLLSVFYEPSIECNAVTPWLQGALAAIDSLAGDNTYIVGRMCMERAPKIACLWLGSSILGLQKRLLQDVRYGLIPIDLHSAVWSGTVQSFIQESVSNPLVAHGHVARADECRLLFLSQSGHHARVPVCQWAPFGATPVEDVDLKVRLHAECEGHGLKYRGFFWDGTDDKSELPWLGKASIRTHPNRLFMQDLNGVEQIPISYGALDREKEVISENLTRNIFGWLRFDGYTRHEREIWTHEWFHMSDSDEDIDQNDVCSETELSHLESWISGLP